MIIDAHCHVWEEKLMSEELKEILYEIARQFGYDKELIMDGTVERLIREMDEAGIDKTVILALDYEFAFKGDVTFRDYNDYVANILKEYPDPRVYPAMLNAAVTSFAMAFWNAFQEYITELGELYGLKPPEVEESG